MVTSTTGSVTTEVGRVAVTISLPVPKRSTTIACRTSMTPTAATTLASRGRPRRGPNTRTCSARPISAAVASASRRATGVATVSPSEILAGSPTNGST